MAFVVGTISFIFGAVRFGFMHNVISRYVFRPHPPPHTCFSFFPSYELLQLLTGQRLRKLKSHCAGCENWSWPGREIDLRCENWFCGAHAVRIDFAVHKLAIMGACILWNQFCQAVHCEASAQAGLVNSISAGSRSIFSQACTSPCASWNHSRSLYAAELNSPGCKLVRELVSACAISDFGLRSCAN